MSNWTIERLEAANDWAAAHGRPPIAWRSSSLSLAKPKGARWPGTIASDDESSRSWYATHRTQLMAWSPTANGYFADGADHREPRFEAYRTAANEARQRRAAELGAARGLTATQVALAWVMHQPFAPVALIGTRSVAHLGEAIEAGTIDLTEAELAWLEGQPDPTATSDGRPNPAATWA